MFNILFPPLYFFSRGKPVEALLAIVLCCTICGWPLASMMAISDNAIRLKRDAEIAAKAAREAAKVVGKTTSTIGKAAGVAGKIAGVFRRKKKPDE